jgi:hypothetical protein
MMRACQAMFEKNPTMHAVSAHAGFEYAGAEMEWCVATMLHNVIATRAPLHDPRQCGVRESSAIGMPGPQQYPTRRHCHAAQTWQD